MQEILAKAGRRALGGGISGALAGVFQVLLLMWLRTTMNYQYRYGGGFTEALQSLWDQGGIPRLYQGFQWAVIQNPLSRFGDTASNAGMMALWDSFEGTKSLPAAAKTVTASAAVMSACASLTSSVTGGTTSVSSVSVSVTVALLPAASVTVALTVSVPSSRVLRSWSATTQPLSP